MKVLHTLDIIELEDSDFYKDLIGGELIPLCQWLKSINKKTKKQLGYISSYAPDDWVDDLMQTIVKRKKSKAIYFLLRVPKKTGEFTEEVK